MASIWMWQKIGPDRDVWTERARGSGKVSDTKEFDLKITSQQVVTNQTYAFTLSSAEPDDSNKERYLCTIGANTGGTATFKNVNLSASIDEESSAASRTLRSALLAAEKKVTILIADEDFDTLKDSNYRLCFAKRVGDADYNVVWQAYKKYLETNDFSWTPQYQLFGSNIFRDSIIVKVATRLVDIGLGETSVLTENGKLLPPTTRGPTTSLNLENQYGSIHPGVNQLATGVDGEQVSKPIYVSPVPIVKGTTSLTPRESVLVWFEQNIETSTMFSSSRSKAVEIDLTRSSEATRLYTDGKWINPG